MNLRFGQIISEDRLKVRFFGQRNWCLAARVSRHIYTFCVITIKTENKLINTEMSIIELAHYVIRVRKSISMFLDMEGNKGRHCNNTFKMAQALSVLA